MHVLPVPMQPPSASGLRRYTKKRYEYLVSTTNPQCLCSPPLPKGLRRFARKELRTQLYAYPLVLMQPPSAKGPGPAKAPSPVPTKAPSPASGVRPSRNLKGSKVAPAPEDEMEVKKVEKTEVKKQVEIVNGTPPERTDGNWEPVSIVTRSW